jgi:hypothetical protein
LPAPTLLMEGLIRIAASIDGLPLLAGKGQAGAYPNTAAGKEAACFCEDKALVRVLREETRGKNRHSHFGLSSAGRRWLKEHCGPRPLLEQLGQVLQERAAELGLLKKQLEAQEVQLHDLKALVTEALRDLQNEPAFDQALPLPGEADILAALASWQNRELLKDASLPDLFRAALAATPDMTIGQFHDACRALARKQRIYLHPWTGPLFEMAEPALALLAGHEIAYYASLRAPASDASTDTAPFSGYTCAANASA